MVKLSNRSLLIVIAILLFIIALPVIKGGYISVVDVVSRQIERNKDNYCKRKFPAYLHRAISREELKLLVDEILEKDVYGGYDAMYKDEYNNPNGLSTHEMVTRLHIWRLEDTRFPDGYFDSYANKCTRGNIYLTEELPWYRM